MTSETLEDLREENTYLRELIVGLTGGAEARLPGLTPLESRIARTLLKAKGADVPRTAMLEAMYWDHPNGYPEQRIIDVCISRIRKKRPDLGRITVTYGYGYRLEPVL